MRYVTSKEKGFEEGPSYAIAVIVVVPEGVPGGIVAVVVTGSVIDTFFTLAAWPPTRTCTSGQAGVARLAP